MTTNNTAADAAPRTIRTQCCIAGGGPAGVMTGYLLARGGVDVLVLEKHADFLRDFRGDTVHPSTLQVLHELGLLEAFLRRPHQKVERLTGFVEDEAVTVADFSRLRVAAPYIVFMPQWDFLDFVAEQAGKHAGFRLRTQAEVEDLIMADGRVAGVRAHTPDGVLEVRADVTIGADGRHSVVRRRAGLAVEELGAPMDVLWFRLPRQPDDPEQVLGRFGRGRIMVMLDRGDYWQCGYVIPKGGNDEVRARGLDAFRREVAKAAPVVGDRTAALRTWEDVKLLTVVVDRLKRWHRPGLLCIGDAAHAMSPVGGVGINLAIQDAVAAANVLAPAFRRGAVAERTLRAVQRRRMFPTRVTQRIQVAIQNRVVARTLQGAAPVKLPWVLRQLQRHPALRVIPARLVGIGVRPEHVSPELRSR